MHTHKWINVQTWLEIMKVVLNYYKAWYYMIYYKLQWYYI